MIRRRPACSCELCQNFSCTHRATHVLRMRDGPMPIPVLSLAPCPPHFGAPAAQFTPNCCLCHPHILFRVIIFIHPLQFSSSPLYFTFEDSLHHSFVATVTFVLALTRAQKYSRAL